MCNAEGTHATSSSIPSWLFDILFIETNDAYRNLLRRRILEGLKIGKGASFAISSPFASLFTDHPNILSQSSKPDDSYE